MLLADARPDFIAVVIETAPVLIGAAVIAAVVILTVIIDTIGKVKEEERLGTGPRGRRRR
jgi:hypothetical protein